ncbi:MAG: isoaspartyl peptidase/L-asparaginase [Bacteroidota bacterium]
MPTSDVVLGTVPASGPLLLVHGGAWDIPGDEVEAHLDGIRRALRVGRRVLDAGRPALDVVTEAVAALEDHPAFDAGRGAVLDRDGLPQLDAGVMEGETLRWGAVASVRALPNPVRTARRLVDSDGQARLLVGEGAERFAAEAGEPAIDPGALIVDRERRRHAALLGVHGYHTSQAFAGSHPRGTVGGVARDADGQLASATSTGGVPFGRSGRVGDSPLVGAGFWADRLGAASATGWGEAIATVQLCTRACDALASGLAPAEAAAARLRDMRGRIQWEGAAPATGGLILLGSEGPGGWAFTTPRMARGWWSGEAGEGAAVDP